MSVLVGVGGVEVDVVTAAQQVVDELRHVADGDFPVLVHISFQHRRDLGRFQPREHDLVDRTAVVDIGFPRDKAQPGRAQAVRDRQGQRQGLCGGDRQGGVAADRVQRRPVGIVDRHGQGDVDAQRFPGHVSMDGVKALARELGRGERERNVPFGDIQGDVPVADIGGRQFHPVITPPLIVVVGKLRQLLTHGP